MSASLRARLACGIAAALAAGVPAIINSTPHIDRSKVEKYSISDRSKIIQCGIRIRIRYHTDEHAYQKFEQAIESDILLNVYGLTAFDDYIPYLDGSNQYLYFTKCNNIKAIARQISKHAFKVAVMDRKSSRVSMDEMLKNVGSDKSIDLLFKR